MIKLFVSDLDGCIAHPFYSPDWDAISQIKKLNNLSKTNPEIPPLTICSGRPLPFVEAVAQWLDVDSPMIFESGGGMYNFTDNKLKWNPHFDDAARNSIIEIKHWLENEVIVHHPGTIPEFTKFTDAGLINPDSSKIRIMHKEILNHIHQNYSSFEVHDTEVSVNVILKKTNKAEGIRLLCSELGLEPDEIAYIGDSSGDVPALEIVGKSFAPINATSHVKKTVDLVTEEATHGVLEAYHHIIEYNKSLK